MSIPSEAILCVEDACESNCRIFCREQVAMHSELRWTHKSSRSSGRVFCSHKTAQLSAPSRVSSSSAESSAEDKNEAVVAASAGPGVAGKLLRGGEGLGCVFSVTVVPLEDEGLVKAASQPPKDQHVNH